RASASGSPRGGRREAPSPGSWSSSREGRPCAGSRCWTVRTPARPRTPRRRCRGALRPPTSRRRPTAPGDLDDDVRRLHHARRAVADLEAELRRCLRGHERDQAMRSGEDRAARGDGIALDARDDAFEAIAGRRRGARRRGAFAPARGLEPRDLGEGDEPLATTRSRRPQTTFGGPATHRLDGHAEQLGRLTDANRPRCIGCDTYILAAFPCWIRRLASTKRTGNGPLMRGPPLWWG